MLLSVGDVVVFEAGGDRWACRSDERLRKDENGTDCNGSRTRAYINHADEV